MEKQTSNKKGLNRRAFLQIVAVAGAAGAIRFFPFTPEDLRFQVIRKSVPMMGTLLNLTVYSKDRDQAEAAVSATFSRMRELENNLSRHIKESEVSRLNQTGFLAKPSTELLTVLELADTVNKKTAGAFDLTILPLLTLYQQQGLNLIQQPTLLNSLVQSFGHEGIQFSSEQIRLRKPKMAITLDGIGKGYIVDQGVDTLNRFGFQQVLVEAGGDLLVKGGKPQGAPWRIGIKNPRPDMSGELITVEVESMAVATSGDYYQSYSPDLLYHHIINPHTGFSPPELASCTVTAPNAALADALATGCMVLGRKDGMDLLAGMDDCEGLFISKDLTIWKTDGFTA